MILQDGRWAQSRGLLTHILEPPVTALGGQRHDEMAVIERPYTVILAQDDGFYRDDWHDLFSQSLVNEHGLSYARFSISQSSSELSLDAILQEMGRDLAPIPAPIWISRGPVMSWMAQFYLESLPLAGLVMVDPMPLDDTAAVRRLETIFRRSEQQQQSQSPSLSTSLSHCILKEYVEHWDHWTLRLEPGSVPMLVLSTLYDDADFVRGAQQTVRRHSVQISSRNDSGGADDDRPGGEGDFRFVPLNRPTSDKVEQQAIMDIVNWIDEHVH